VWFVFLIVVAFVVAVGVTTLLPPAPVPDPTCDPANVTDTQLRHALEFRSWLTYSYVTTFIVMSALAFSWLYLQVAHGLSALWMVLWNVGLTGLAALAAGSWVRNSATSWAASQPGTCLDETLRSSYRWDVSLLSGWSYAFQLGDWHWAVFLDVVMLALFAAMLGSLAYFAMRKVVNI